MPSSRSIPTFSRYVSVVLTAERLADVSFGSLAEMDSDIAEKQGMDLSQLQVRVRV
jgi:hypothetical protein